MFEERIYDDLPYPLPHLPLPGEPVTVMTISDVIVPLLETVECVLHTFGEAGQLGALTNRHVGKTLSSMSGYVELAIGLLRRLKEEGEEGHDDDHTD